MHLNYWDHMLEMYFSSCLDLGPHLDLQNKLISHKVSGICIQN